MRRYLAAILGAVVLMTAACSEDESNLNRPEPFLFQLTVKTPVGAPVEGLEARIDVPLVVVAPARGSAPTNEAKAMAKVRLSAPVQARVHVEFLDLRHRLVRDLTDGVLEAAGAYEFAFDARNDSGEALLGTVALWCRVQAFDPQSQARIFADSTLAVLYTGVDAELRPLLGSTDARGVVRSEDPLLFPGIFDLGPITAIDETGAIAGSFTISQEVDVYLHDPNAQIGADQRTTVTVGPGLNRFEVIWDPAGKAAPPPGDEIAARPAPVAAPSRSAVERAGESLEPPPSWRILVYPNPFN